MKMISGGQGVSDLTRGCPFITEVIVYNENHFLGFYGVLRGLIVQAILGIMGS